jgi:hypothetical protein
LNIDPDPWWFQEGAGLDGQSINASRVVVVVELAQSP